MPEATPPEGASWGQEGAFYGQEGGRRLRRGVVQESVVVPEPHDPTGSQARHLP
jgi:hypothetical protein